MIIEKVQNVPLQLLYTSACWNCSDDLSVFGSDRREVEKIDKNGRWGMSCDGGGLGSGFFFASLWSKLKVDSVKAVAERKTKGGQERL